ncbi:acyl transferase [Arcticibacter sp.]|uniref:LuxE/PaaK family acyltransferase n=1 Tax=Arcticibacter sp. TaxID=1872630 RepID=UPI003890C547
MEHVFSKPLFLNYSEENFNNRAIDVFRFQVTHNPVYASFVKGLRKDPELVTHISDIPYMPVEFFKNHRIICGTDSPAKTFSSSGTTGMVQSKHEVLDLSVYEESFRKAFELFYGDVRDLVILALLPSYLERDGSSLIYMVEDLIQRTGNPKSGYFLYNHDELFQTLLKLRDAGSKVILIGVTYALLDFVEHYTLDFPDLIVMETGGMKGKRREMIREELHEQLCEGFGVDAIHSEYGMTELLSQAYSSGRGLFRCPPWMRINIRDINDPLSLLSAGATGGINVIDLGNVYSCSFIATQDLGRKYEDGSFEIIGRFDNSDIRGCNLLVQ